MRFRPPSIVAAVAALWLTEPDMGFAAGDAAGCRELPRPRMSIKLTINSSNFPGSGETIRSVVQQVWGREGLELQWLPGMASASWEGVDLWVVVQHEPVAPDDPLAVGSVLFAAEEPTQIVRISIDAAIDWVRRGLARRHRIPEPRSRLFLETDIGPEVERTLAYGVAHEIGHVVLAERGHARGGLMQANLRSLVKMTRGAGAIHLDTRSRRRLADCLESAARCAQQ